MAILNEYDLRSTCSEIVHQNVTAAGIVIADVDYSIAASEPTKSTTPTTSKTPGVPITPTTKITPVMVLAVTFDRIFLLDWEGTERIGNGPTRILFEFSKKLASVDVEVTKAMKAMTNRGGKSRVFGKCEKRRKVTIVEGGTKAFLEMDLGFLAPNRSMNRKAMREIERFCDLGVMV